MEESEGEFPGGISTGGDTSTVYCPYCCEAVELYVDPESEGSFVEDCEICCRPWQVSVQRSGGQVQVLVDRAY